MREQKLTDICKIQYGYPFDAARFSSFPEDGMPLIRIRDVKEGRTETYYKGDYPKEYIIHKNDYLIGMDGEFNIAPWQSEDALLNQRVCKIESNSSEVSTKYLYRFLKKELKRVEDETPFATVKHLSAKRLNHVYLPVPPLSEQELIVAELDLLTGIIDKQKAQLQELDTLAQSIFYDMFGDPEENEKGWEMYEIASVCDDLFAGGDKPKDFSEEKDDDYKYPIIGNGDGERGILGYSKSYRVGKAAVTIGARGASIGNCRICEPHFTPVVRLITLVPNKRVNLGYLYAISRKLSFNVNGAGQAQLTTPNVANKLIPVPPRELQDSFAEKIQSIESQKSSINRSIAETQKLFDYTMDKYFG